MRWSRTIALLAAGMLLPAFVSQSPKAGYRLQVTGDRLQRTGYRLQGTGYRKQVIGNREIQADSSLRENAQEPTAVQEPTPAPTATLQPAQPGNGGRNTPIFFVMIDPAHGGEDRGAVFGANLAEKDITLALARRLKAELQERGIGARLLRDGDISLSLDERAESTNEQHAAAYIALHAGVPGQGVRVYAPALLSVAPLIAGKFLLWEGAQANSLPHSQELAQRITVELDKKNVSATQLATPLRPLNNVSAPAVAIELTPAPEGPQNLMGQKFQAAVAAGIAAGISQLRSQLEEER
jgi:N-acetylmuramoyl-L-alanine amidase